MTGTDSAYAATSEAVFNSNENYLRRGVCCYEVGATRDFERDPHHNRQALLSAYALATRGPVLTERMIRPVAEVEVPAPVAPS
eukprot:1333770-Rhodomonas_salina.2